MTSGGDACWPRILVVDDEPETGTVLTAALRLVGMDVLVVHSGREALRQSRTYQPHLVVLNMLLPDMSGTEVARMMNVTGSGVGVLFLTDGDTADDRIAGLAAGGDDCMTKPFHIGEITLRIRSILRRQCAVASGAAVARYADLELDEQSHEVRRAGRVIHLSRTEFELLRYLLANADRVVTKSQIISHVWRYDFIGNSRIVASCMCGLRRKVDQTEPQLLHTVRGIGYSLRLPRREDA